MARRGNPFSQNCFVDDNYETSFTENFILEQTVNTEVEVPEHLYPIPFEVMMTTKYIQGHM